MSTIFKPGKLTFVLDGGAGSSAKGIRGANIWRHMRGGHTKFAINTFMENAAHSIAHTDDKEMVHQCLSSVTTLPGCETQFISPGAVFAVDTFTKEIDKANKFISDLSGSSLNDSINSNTVKIHPNLALVTEKDVLYEKGLVDFEGNKKDVQESLNLKIGSTLHGVGAARARRVLRRPDALIARDVPELAPFVANTNELIMERLTKGESGLGEIAQGYQLSLMSRFYPRTTSRNCSISAFLDDSLLPPSVCGPVVVNFRTFPIRVNNNKYVRKSDGKILTWAEFNETKDEDKTIVKGNSGDGYPDQKELSWDEISMLAGDKIFECTTLTKLPRRAFSFSKINLLEALIFNNTGDDVYISVNFMNYVDASVRGKRTLNEVLTPKVIKWIKENVWSSELVTQYKINNINIKGLFIGTWKTIDDSVFIDINDLLKL
jgi:hypothetical protein